MLPFYIACIKRKKDCKQLNFTSQEVEKEEQMKNKVNRRKKITIRAEINKIEKRKKNNRKINKSQSWFLKKINKISKTQLH